MNPVRRGPDDGHNAIFAVPSLHALQVTDRRDEARQALADRLGRFAHARGEKVLVVFDGNELASNPDSTYGPMLEIVYTRRGEGGADDRILVEHALDVLRVGLAGPKSGKGDSR